MKQFLILIFISTFFGTSIAAQAKKKQSKKVVKKATPTKQNTAPPVSNPPPVNASPQKNNNDVLGLNLGTGSHIKKGSTVLDLGVGFSGYGIPLHLGYERTVAQDISIGFFGNFLNYNLSNYTFSNYSYYLLYAGVKGNYYFNHLLGYGKEKYQLYAGLNLGYAKLFTSDNNFNAFSSKPFLGGQIGIRFFIKSRVGIYAEGDYSGAGGGTIGATFRFK